MSQAVQIRWPGICEHDQIPGHSRGYRCTDTSGGSSGEIAVGTTAADVNMSVNVLQSVYCVSHTECIGCILCISHRVYRVYTVYPTQSV